MNKRNQKALEYHLSWLEKRGISPTQIKARKKNFKNPTIAFPDLSVPREYVSLETSGAPKFKQTAMSLRYFEKPEVRAEIEKKSMRIGLAFSKGPYQYISDDNVKYQGKKNVQSD